MLMLIIFYVVVIIGLCFLTYVFDKIIYEEPIVKLINARLGVCYNRKYKYKNVIKACEDDLNSIINDSKKRNRIELEKNKYENKLVKVNTLIEEYENLLTHMDEK